MYLTADQFILIFMFLIAVKDWNKTDKNIEKGIYHLICISVLLIFEQFILKIKFSVSWNQSIKIFLSALDQS